MSPTKQELVGEVSEIPGLPVGDCQAYVQAVRESTLTGKNVWNECRVVWGLG